MRDTTDPDASIPSAARAWGRTTAARLAREGVDVAIFAVAGARWRQRRRRLAATGARVVPIAADITHPDDCERVVRHTVKRLGGLDVLVTNMGGPPYGPAAPRSDADWQQAWELVTMSVIRLCREAVPHMRQRAEGAS